MADGADCGILLQLHKRSGNMPKTQIPASSSLANVRYEIRGRLARRAHDMERLGYEIISLNIGNPGAFGFRAPETMRLAMIENMASAEGYCHQKGIFPAREAVVMQQQERGVLDVTAEDVFIGNGVSELIDLVLRALLENGDEVLVPSPDYPLWTAAVTLNDGKAVHYPCRPDNGFEPDPADIERLVSKRTRAIVVINPNNPTGDCEDRREAPTRGLRRRDLRRHDLRRCRVPADGDLRTRYVMRDDVRLVEGIPCLRLSRGLGLLLRCT
jgi:DNA-binding transcriptional MocR family regulator